MSDYTEFSLIADNRIKVIAPSESCFVNIKNQETAIRFRDVDGKQSQIIMPHELWESKWIKK
jgi:hypothetical protein